MQEGMTALMHACISGIMQAVKLLIHNGANIHTQNIVRNIV